LWRTLLARTSAPEVTVNASVYAAPVYARWGFVATQPPQQRMGLAYVPMRWLRTA
jgi:predicted GNAT family N-acyltransferase